MSEFSYSYADNIADHRRFHQFRAPEWIEAIFPLMLFIVSLPVVQGTRVTVADIWLGVVTAESLLLVAWRGRKSLKNSYHDGLSRSPSRIIQTMNARNVTASNTSTRPVAYTSGASADAISATNGTYPPKLAMFTIR